MCCCECFSDIFLVIVLVLFPPLPVWIRRGICLMDSLINILLCILGYFPGLIHSWYVIAKYPPYSRRYELKVYYIYQNLADLESQTQRSNHHHHHHHHHSGAPSAVSQQPLAILAPNYGSTNEHVTQEGSSNGNSAPPAYSEISGKK